MTKRESYEKRTEELATPLAKAVKAEVYDVEYVKEGSDYILRVTLDKKTGVLLSDCETVSRALSKSLDEEDFIREGYILEVTSPGLGRLLKKEKDYQRNMGSLIEIHLFRPVNKEKDFVGILTDYTENEVTIQIKEQKKTFIKKDISKICEYVDFNDEKEARKK